MMPSSLQKCTADTLQQLIDVLIQLDPQVYQGSLSVLSGSSIGKHVRHITEFYQCLFAGTDSKEVNYDARKRNLQLEIDSSVAIHTLYGIIQQVLTIQEDETVRLRVEYTLGQPLWIPSTLFRELIYNLEHCIHHLATIRIGVMSSTQKYTIPESFGVAPSTILYQQSVCAQ